MPADQPEVIDQDKLLGDFKERYKRLIEDNQRMAKMIRNNEQQALKLQGAIETLEYCLGTENEAEPAPEVDNVDAA
nr:hypothetical protein [uncultured Mediterranean phage uvMED]|tara:strand:+ start:103 stop:330 length:228 start_codon:yes stop_codon:yes gene_type:complete